MPHPSDAPERHRPELPRSRWPRAATGLRLIGYISVAVAVESLLEVAIQGYRGSSVRLGADRLDLALLVIGTLLQGTSFVGWWWLSLLPRWTGVRWLARGVVGVQVLAFGVSAALTRLAWPSRPLFAVWSVATTVLTVGAWLRVARVSGARPKAFGAFLTATLGAVILERVAILAGSLMHRSEPRVECAIDLFAAGLRLLMAWWTVRVLLDLARTVAGYRDDLATAFLPEPAS